MPPPKQSQTDSNSINTRKKKENSFYTEKGTRKPLIQADEVEVGELWATFMVSGMRFGVSVLQLQT